LGVAVLEAAGPVPLLHTRLMTEPIAYICDIHHRTSSVIDQTTVSETSTNRPPFSDRKRTVVVLEAEYTMEAV
jgi:hypothetical protein